MNGGAARTVLGCTVAALAAMPLHAAKEPFLKCSPRVLAPTGSVVLSMSMPHPAELAVKRPDGTYFFLVYEPSADAPAGSAPLHTKQAFGELTELKLGVADAMGTPWVAGRELNERIFTLPGVYTFVLTEVLETEDLPVYECRVRFKGERK